MPSRPTRRPPTHKFDSLMLAIGHERAAERQKFATVS